MTDSDRLSVDSARIKAQIDAVAKSKAVLILQLVREFESETGAWVETELKIHRHYREGLPPNTYEVELKWKL